MPKPCPKLAVLAVLSHEPDFSALRAMPDLDSRSGRNTLRWLDESGLSLALLRQLQTHQATPHISHGWHEALTSRYAHNLERTRDMFQEAQRIYEALLSRGILAAVLKGFSLTPDFCADPSFRHQTDFDILVAPGSVPVAAGALVSCGYSTTQLNESGESCFITPLRHIPSSRDDLYAVQRHRQVDLHVSIWEPCAWLPLAVPQDCLEYAQPQCTDGFEYLSLSLEDKFLMQLLHAFRHSLRSWMRVSWLLEIATFLTNHRVNEALWNRVMERVGPTWRMNAVCAFVLGMVTRLFRTTLPAPLCAWTAEATSPRMLAWLEHFAVDWAIADRPGSLTNLFLAGEFIPNAQQRMQYYRSRLVPGTKQTSIGQGATKSPKEFFRWQAARVSYVAKRAMAHLKDLVTLAQQELRWKRALASSRRPSFDANR